MTMSFGDWELFRTLISMLRERENALATSSSSSEEILNEPTDIDVPRNFQPLNMQQQPRGAETKMALQAPKPQYARAQSVDRDQSDKYASQVPPIIENPADIEEFKCKQPRTGRSKGGMVTSSTSTYTHDAIEPEMLQLSPTGPEVGKRRMKRIDSMVTDVIHEANYLHQLMDAQGVGEDLSEEEELPPEQVNIDMTEVSC